jgi:hypothetical protein
VKQEAISLMRFLPPGAADLGEEVTRDDMRAAGIGEWSGRVTHRDDVSCVFDRPPELPEEFDYVVPMMDEVTEPGIKVTRLRFG